MIKCLSLLSEGQTWTKSESFFVRRRQVEPEAKSDVFPPDSDWNRNSDWNQNEESESDPRRSVASA